jgi:SnoaL-like domain
MALTPTDHEEIRQLLMRYSVALDFGDATTLGECFAPDAHFVETGLPEEAGSEARFEGRDSIAAFARSFFDRTRGHLRHWPSLPLIESDGHDATGLTFLMVLRAGAAPGTGVVLTGFYRDRFTKLDGQWYFAVREFAADPQPEHTGTAPGDPLAVRFDDFVAGRDGSAGRCRPPGHEGGSTP